MFEQWFRSKETKKSGPDQQPYQAQREGPGDDVGVAQKDIQKMKQWRYFEVISRYSLKDKKKQAKCVQNIVNQPEDKPWNQTLYIRGVASPQVTPLLCISHT